MILKRFNVERSADTPSQIEGLQKQGYVPVEVRTPVSEMSKADLVKEAEKVGVSTKGLKKAELVEALNERRAGE